MGGTTHIIRRTEKMTLDKEMENHPKTVTTNIIALNANAEKAELNARDVQG